MLEKVSQMNPGTEVGNHQADVMANRCTREVLLL